MYGERATGFWAARTTTKASACIMAAGRPSPLIAAPGVDAGASPAGHAHVDGVPARLLAGGGVGDLVAAAKLLEGVAERAGEAGPRLAVADPPAGLRGQVCEEPLVRRQGGKHAAGADARRARRQQLAGDDRVDD